MALTAASFGECCQGLATVGNGGVITDSRQAQGFAWRKHEADKHFCRWLFVEQPGQPQELKRQSGVHQPGCHRLRWLANA
jgi:hypothetical protein